LGIMDVPKHIALIPDGNRRWAEQKGLKPWEGHEKGIQLFEDFMKWCYDAGVVHITAYSLSKENLDKRDDIEVEFLFRLYEVYLQKLLESRDIEDRQIRVYFIGDTSGFPDSVKELIGKIDEKTQGYKEKTLSLCVNYSGREEILEAARQLVKEGAKKIDEAAFEKHLQTKTPAPDLLIRTAENRISNFLLWQLAYSELFFSPKLFPEFTKDDLMDAMKQFNKTERRYGK